MLAYYQQHPLRVILLSALFVRLIAAVFSIGYGFHDDHFLVIEVSEQWTQHLNLRGWLPSEEVVRPSGHNFFYPILHYVFFLFTDLIGIHNPEIKMLLVRIIHAFYSSLTVYFSFLIVQKLSGVKVAKTVGWVLALLWCLPMLSVRNLVEMACIPPLVMATWYTLKAEEKQQKQLLLLAGFIAGLAFSFRFQSITFIGGLVLACWLQKKWQSGLLLGVGASISIAIVQNSVDLYLWGRPFAEFLEYSMFNINNANKYITGPWYNYLLLVAGLITPPLSFMAFRGMYASKKTYVLVILPALIFFIFHSSYPNKQERFILPVIPFFVMAGVAGWHQFTEQSAYWLKHKKLQHNLWKTFWVLNTLLLLILTPSSTKTSRVKAMSYLYDKECKGTFLLENSNTGKGIAMPQFYSNSFVPYYQLTDKQKTEELIGRIMRDTLPIPEYVIFAESGNLAQREQALRKYIPDISFEAEIPSSYLDRIMTWLNPVNVNQTYYMYKVNSPRLVLPDSVAVGY